MRDSTPAGTYRFRVRGRHRAAQGSAPAPYKLVSDEFTVSPWDGIEVRDLRVDPAGTVSFADAPVTYPVTYDSPFRYIEDNRHTQDGQVYCQRCTFRPWAESGAIASAQVVFRGAKGKERVVPMRRSGGRWVSKSELGDGWTAVVPPGAVRDGFGNDQRHAGDGMIRAALLALALLGALAAPAAAKKPLPYLAGAAKVTADPAENICLGGYGSCANGAGRTMTHVRDPLWARSLAFGDRDGGSMILVHTTNIGLFASYKTIAGVGSYHVRQEIARRTGVPADHVIVQSDHSHAGPDTIGIWGGVPTSYLELLQEAAIDAGERAWASRRPARDQGRDRRRHRRHLLLRRGGPHRDGRRVPAALRRRREGPRASPRSSNYSPHATVLGSGNKGASGDWPEWAAGMAETSAGGIGLGSVGTLGREDFGALHDGDEGEAEARARLQRMLAEATQSAQAVASTGVDVRTTFIREPVAQPVLLANLLPEGAIDAGGYDISIDRDPAPPWITGDLLGTYAGAARIGDVFFGVAPGRDVPRGPVLPARRAGRARGADPLPPRRVQRLPRLHGAAGHHLREGVPRGRHLPRRLPRGGDPPRRTRAPTTGR